MKIKVIILFTGLFFLLTGCQETNGEEIFEGTVITVNDTSSSIIVEPDEDEEIRNSGSEVRISVTGEESYQTGDKVRITHEGPVMESYPLQINVLSIEKVEE